jgi:hypothetical protein
MLEIRYDPDMIKTGLEEVLLYDGNQYLGTARKIHLSDNAVMKRRGREKQRSLPGETPLTKEALAECSPAPAPGNTIRFSAIMDKEV